MSRRAEKARERSRKAVQARTPEPVEPLPPFDESDLAGIPLDALQKHADRDIYAETALSYGSDPLGMLPAATVQHNHMTRDIKPRGQCPACDEYHELEAGR